MRYQAAQAGCTVNTDGAHLEDIADRLWPEVQHTERNASNHSSWYYREAPLFNAQLGLASPGHDCRRWPMEPRWVRCAMHPRHRSHAAAAAGQARQAHNRDSWFGSGTCPNIDMKRYITVQIDIEYLVTMSIRRADVRDSSE